VPIAAAAWSDSPELPHLPRFADQLALRAPRWLWYPPAAYALVPGHCKDAGTVQSTLILKGRIANPSYQKDATDAANP